MASMLPYIAAPWILWVEPYCSHIWDETDGCGAKKMLSAFKKYVPRPKGDATFHEEEQRDAKCQAGWWFGTCLIFPYIGNVINQQELFKFPFNLWLSQRPDVMPEDEDERPMAAIPTTEQLMNTYQPSFFSHISTIYPCISPNCTN